MLPKTLKFPLDFKYQLFETKTILWTLALVLISEADGHTGEALNLWGR